MFLSRTWWIISKPLLSEKAAHQVTMWWQTYSMPHTVKLFLNTLQIFVVFPYTISVHRKFIIPKSKQQTSRNFLSDRRIHNSIVHINSVSYHTVRLPSHVVSHVKNRLTSKNIKKNKEIFPLDFHFQHNFQLEGLYACDVQALTVSSEYLSSKRPHPYARTRRTTIAKIQCYIDSFRKYCVSLDCGKSK